jgi:hypothetical protein
MNEKLPTREILKPAYDALRERFPNESISVSLKFEYDKDGRGGWNIETLKYGHTVRIDYESFNGDTLEDAMSSAIANFKPKDPARTEAAKKLREQAAAVEKGEAPIPC